LVVKVAVGDCESPEELHALESIFAAYGIDANVTPELHTRRAGSFPYIVVVAAPVIYIALAFARGAAEQAGAESWDAYRRGGWRGLRRFLQEIAWAHDTERRRFGTSGMDEIRFEEPDGPSLHLYQHLTDDELRALGDLDWSTMEDGDMLSIGGDGKWRLNNEPAPRRGDQ
jgi:hypothetical protein